MIWFLWAIGFLVFGMVRHKHAVLHAKMYRYKPVMWDVYYWYVASIVMIIIGVIVW